MKVEVIIVPPNEKEDEFEQQQDSTVVPSVSIEQLMPELEQLVAKNPNKLIGCGG